MTKSLLFPIVVKFHAKILPRLENLIVVDNSKINRGFTKAVNLGIKKALDQGAQAVLLVNPDLKISQEQVNTLLDTPGDIIGPVLTFDRQGQRIYDFGGRVNFVFGRATHWENQQPAASNQIDYVSGACMLIRKKVIDKIGQLDERFFMYFEDVDFCLRAKKAGFSVVVNPRVFIEHQINEQRFSKNRQKTSHLLTSQWLFITSWVPWYFRAISYGYLLLLKIKIILNFYGRQRSKN